MPKPRFALGRRLPNRGLAGRIRRKQLGAASGVADSLRSFIADGLGRQRFITQGSDCLSWLSEFHYANGEVLVKKTGTILRLDKALRGDIFAWLVFYAAVQSLRIGAWMRVRRAPKLAFAPDRPRPWYLAWPVLKAAGVRMVRDAAKADIVFHFDDSTDTSAVALPAPAPKARTINYHCRDVSKTRVGVVFEAVFGYPLAVDPRSFSGAMVEKSEKNGAHDGRIVQGPLEPLPNRTYQRVIDNSMAPQNGREILVEDLRTPMIWGQPALVFRKRRNISRRFANDNVDCVLARPEEVFSHEEIAKLCAFAAALGLDWGGLDVLRDRADGRIYIVDANKTDMGPPISLPLADKLKAIKILARAFNDRAVQPL